jgi:hypothetical protein
MYERALISTSRQASRGRAVIRGPK